MIPAAVEKSDFPIMLKKINVIAPTINDFKIIYDRHKMEALLPKMTKTRGIIWTMKLEQVIILSFLFCVGIFGVMFNGIFLLVNVLKRNFSLDYCIFVYNLAFINFVYNLNLITLQATVIMNGYDERGLICTISGYILTSTALIGIMNQAFLAMNRYCLLFNQSLHKLFFENNRIKFLYLVLLYVFCFVFEMGFYLWNDFGFFDGICCVAFKRTPVWHFIVLFVIPVSFSYLTCIFVAYRISVLVKSHISNNVDRIAQSRIREGRSIVKFISLEIGVPIMLESPILIAIVFNDLFQMPLILDTIFTGLFILHTAVDPLVTVTVIKPYRHDFLRFVHKIYKKGGVQPMTTNGMMNTMHPQTTNNHVQSEL
uniref:G-protein coupled receptors family 1 profile domain-containing protein n=1 Tax=Romanomermis culicivorax TaxID=13658 RepID=A0A915ISH3_ROMCU